jgi:transposase-like protein
MTMDGSDANAAAITSSNAEHGTASVIRQGPYRKHVVEQDHRAVKRVTRPMLEVKACEAAQAPLAGIALMPRIKQSP